MSDKHAVAAGLCASVLLARAARDELAAGLLVGVPLAGPALHQQTWTVLPANLAQGAPARVFLERVQHRG